MNIKINNKYHLTSDLKQFILHETVGNTEILSYFTSIASVSKALILKQVRSNKNIRTLAQLGKKINEYAKEIENKFIYEKNK